MTTIEDDLASNCHKLLEELDQLTKPSKKTWDANRIRFLVCGLREAFGHVQPVELDDDGDLVESPSHYVRDGIEVVKVLQTFLTGEEFEGWCRGNILAYQLRARWKDNCEMDLKKADKMSQFLTRHLDGVELVD